MTLIWNLPLNFDVAFCNWLDKFLPPTAASLHIDYPMLFELRNASAERVSHCGVLEFIAEEGMIYMPYWVGIYAFFLGFELVLQFAIRKFNCRRCILVI